MHLKPTLFPLLIFLSTIPILSGPSAAASIEAKVSETSPGLKDPSSFPSASFPSAYASASPISSLDPEPPSLRPYMPYGLSPVLDLSLLAGLMAMKSHSGAMLKETRSNPVDLASLDARQVPAYDRWAVGFYSSSLSAVSSGLAWSQLLIPLAANAWDIRQGAPWHSALADVVILEEALMLSTSLSSYAKSFRIHSTPLSYDPNVNENEKRIPQNASSFFSNHTASAFTTAVFTGYTYQLRHPGSPLVPWVWGTTLTMATGVGALRIMAGKHFPSDVAAGALVGALCGYVVPRLHLRLSAFRSRNTSLGTASSPESGKRLAASRPKALDVQLGVAFPGGSTTPVPTLNLNF